MYVITLKWEFVCFNSAESDPVVVEMPPLLRIFQGIINCLCSTGASHWKIRCSLYGAILYYMQIGKLQTSVYERGITIVTH